MSYSLRAHTGLNLHPPTLGVEAPAAEWGHLGRGAVHPAEVEGLQIGSGAQYSKLAHEEVAGGCPAHAERDQPAGLRLLITRPPAAASPASPAAAATTAVALAPVFAEPARPGQPNTVPGLGPDRNCSPRHMMSCNSRSEDSKCVSMTWHATSSRPY